VLCPEENGSPVIYGYVRRSNPRRSAPAEGRPSLLPPLAGGISRLVLLHPLFESRASEWVRGAHGESASAVTALELGLGHSASIVGRLRIFSLEHISMRWPFFSQPGFSSSWSSSLSLSPSVVRAFAVLSTTACLYSHWRTAITHTPLLFIPYEPHTK